jgi:hypothetical protein
MDEQQVRDHLGGISKDACTAMVVTQIACCAEGGLAGPTKLARPSLWTSCFRR